MTRLGVLITPGAGTAADHPSLLAIEAAVAALEPRATIVRLDFPYRLAGRRAPDRAPVLVDAVRAGVEQLASRAGIDVADIVIGGRSMGGRMCSLAVAEGLAVRGLFCVSYPLHPPGRPDRLRTDHFPAITVPTLFVSGTRDAFGAPDEFASHTPAIAGRFEHVWIEGGDHSLTRQATRAAEHVAAWISALTSSPGSAGPPG